MSFNISQSTDLCVDEFYTLTIEVQGEGSTLPDKGLYYYRKGTVVDITASPESGWEFKEWIGDVFDRRSQSTSVLLNRDLTIRSLFIEEETAMVDPRIDDAIAWALSLHQARTFPDGTHVEGFCLRFVQDAYEKGAAAPITRYVGARLAAERTGAMANIDVKIPRGAFVYYDWVGSLKEKYKNWGHVGLFLGNNKMIHAFKTVRIDDIHRLHLVDDFQYKGWSWPSLRPPIGDGITSLSMA